MTQRAILFATPLLLLMAVLWGCENDTSNDIGDGGGGGPVVTENTCIGCHSSEEDLKAALGVEKVTIKVANKDDG